MSFTGLGKRIWHMFIFRIPPASKYIFTWSCVSFCTKVVIWECEGSASHNSRGMMYVDMLRLKAWHPQQLIAEAAACSIQKRKREMLTPSTAYPTPSLLWSWRGGAAFPCLRTESGSAKLSVGQRVWILADHITSHNGVLNVNAFSNACEES